jgi:hypothetical protein
MGYKVVIDDGPAEGWSYVTSVPPDPVIAVAPQPREDEFSRSAFMRVLTDGEPWPGQHQYARGELPGVDVLLDELEDVLVRYRVVQ